MRDLPANVEYETAVLGSCLLAHRLLPDAESLTDEDFSLDRLRVVFSAMRSMHEAGTPIEDTTLVEQLQRSGELETAGGVTGVADLTMGMPRYSSIATYVERVKEKSRLRRLIRLAQTLDESAYSQDESAADIASRIVPELLAIDDRSVGQGGLVREILSSPESRPRILSPHRSDRVPSGFPDLDRKIGGFERGSFTLLAARPSTGKTSLALNIAANVGRSGLPVAVFSFESSKETLLRRMICAEARVDSVRHRDGLLNEDENRKIRSAVAEVSQWPVHLYDSSGSTVAHIASTARRLHAKGSLGLVVVDYLQLIASKGRVENRNVEVSRLSRNLRTLASTLKVPVLALSQLSREPERSAGDPRPKLSHLRDSGSLEQDADIVMLLFRGELYQPDKIELHGHADLNIAKNRDGRTGYIPLRFCKEYTRFETPTDRLDPDEYATI